MKESTLTNSTPLKNQSLDTVSIDNQSLNKVFFCPEESQFYSQCIEKMVLMDCINFDSIIEFGSGDGSPMINCLIKRRLFADTGMIQGYELNSQACQLAESKIKQYQLKNKYIIHNKCFFKYSSPEAKYLIANPPYLPSPDSNIYMPSLHGGKDGSTITTKLLSLGYENVMVLVSSYSNPVETVNYALSQGYQVVDFMISPLPFGYYSAEPKVRHTISELKKNQKAFYSQNIYFLAGVLFQKKQKNFNLDLSKELIKVMTAL